MRISDWSSDVCSSDLGKADRAAAAVAMLHPSLDLPGAAEQLDGLARPAFAPVRTNDGGGVDLALAGHHRLDGSDAENVLGAHRIQEPRGARSEERRVGREWGSTCRSRGAPATSKKK